MSIKLTDNDFALALNFISARTGMNLPSTNYNIFKEFLEERLDSGSLSCSSYLKLIDSDKDEYYKFIDAVTINETYFFREEKQFILLRNELPALLKKNRPVNIWSAACSSGEEAISLYLMAEDVLADNSAFSVFASDINNEVLSVFGKGKYRKNSFREDGSRFHELVKKNSGHKDHHFIINPDIVNRIKMFNLNLFDFKTVFNNRFDVVFLRNTLIYFSIDNRSKIISSVIENMNPGGLLFLSSTEMPLISHTDLKLMEQGGVFYFCKKSTEEKKQEIRISELLLNSIQEENKSEADLPALSASKKTDDYIVKPDPDLILEYAGNKVNNRIFSLVNNPNYDLALLLIKIIYRINNSEIAEASVLIDEMEHSSGGENRLTLYLKGYTALINGKRENAFVFLKKALSEDADFWPAGFFASSALMETGAQDAGKYLRACISGIEKYINSNSYRYQILLEGFNGKYFLRICEQWLKRI